MHRDRPVWLLLFLLLCLPIQSIAAFSMPFCDHAQRHGDAAPCHGEPEDETVAPAALCDDCAMCHLCGSPAPMALLRPHQEARQDGSFLLPTGENFRSHIPAHPRRPPRSTLL